MNNNVYILEVDAKDLWLASYAENADETGYRIRDKKGDIRKTKFIGALNYSLDLIKMRDVYRTVFHNRDFTFFSGRKEYSKYVIDVTFEYSVKDFNLVNKNTYVKIGYNYLDLAFTDSVSVLNGELVGIKVDEPVAEAVKPEILGKYFSYRDGVYKCKDNFKCIRSTETLRSELYKNGFVCDGERYVRYKRSSGSSRQGRCLFIHEAMYSRMMKWSRCGLYHIENRKNFDLAAFEAYISLTLSGIIDTIEIKPENILVIDDYNSVFKSEAIVTREVNGELESKLESVEISNNIWDGQSLLDESLFPEKYKRRGMLLLRTRMFKSCGFNTKMQKWFADNNITDIKQLNGFTLATDISQVKMITTPSSIKYLKFGTLEEWLSKIGSTFGVVKHEKPTHYLGGKVVQAHYQLLNSIQMSYNKVNLLVQPSIDYIKLLRDNPAVMRNHIKLVPFEKLSLPSLAKADIVYNLMGINDRFCETKLYDTFRREVVTSYKNNLKRGHIWISGNYSTLVGNPIEMLQSASGLFDGSSQIGVGNVYSKRFLFGTTILGSRSPHVCSSNIYLANNNENNMIDTYFNFTTEIIAVNSINENLLDRLSGADYDSDTMMITNNQLLIDAARKNYDKFIVPLNAVQAKKTIRSYTPEEQADLDNKTGKNKIGDIINLAQELTTKFWHNINGGETFEQNSALYNDIVTLDVLSNIEIDKAKKEFNVDCTNEINKIKSRYQEIDNDGKKIKPLFFGHIAKKKGYYDADKKSYIAHNTTMDYLQSIVSKERKSRSKGSFISFKEIINRSVLNDSSVNYYQIHEIMDMIKECSDKCKSIWCASDCPDMKAILCQEARDDVIDYIARLRINDATMYMLLTYIEKPKYTAISRNIFSILFGYPNKYFYGVLNRSVEPIPILKPSLEGEVELFGERYNYEYTR